MFSQMKRNIENLSYAIAIVSAVCYLSEQRVGLDSQGWVDGW